MPQGAPRVLSVTSGKGGVGKTNLCVNLACELALAGRRVVLLDADIGLANVDVLLGLSPRRNLLDLFNEGVELGDVLFPTPYGFSILPAPSGIAEMALDTGQRLELLEALDPLDEQIDYLIVDTAAGVSRNVLYFNIAARERILVLTPEPTSLVDAYTLVKVLKKEHGVNSFKLVVNMAASEKDAREAFLKLHTACDNFLSGVSLDLLGLVPKDPAVRQAVVEQVPFTRRTPDAPASRAVADLARRLDRQKPPGHLDGNIQFFWKKLLFQD
jgi:flagellar biosynthesis protein FlhG